MSCRTIGVCLEQTTPQLPPTRSQPAMHPPLHKNLRQHPGHLTLSLPPLRQLSCTLPTPSGRRHDNPLSIQSILNHQAELIEQQRDLRRSGLHMETLSPVDTQLSHSLSSTDQLTSVGSTKDEQRPQRLSQLPGRPSARHVLKPKPPSLHMTQSLGGLNRPIGTIDAQQSLSLTATVRPSESAVPHLALPTTAARVRRECLTSLTAPIPSSNTLRTDVHQTSAQFQPSGNTSSTTQYPPYCQSASIVSGYDSHGGQEHYASGLPGATVYDARHSSPLLEMNSNLISVPPSGQSSIQIMTIKSQQGHAVQIPVDVQAASKIADEKRRRNADASARFRARRKEKKREASMSISRLEQQVRDAIDSADFYRTERDYFRSLVYRQPRAKGTT